jgi:hypothetical protein
MMGDSERLRVLPKKYESVADMVKDMLISKDFKEEILEHLAARKLTHLLMAFRALRNLSESDVATKMNYTNPSLIAHWESRADDDWLIRDMRRYAKAVGAEVRIEIVPIEKTGPTSPRAKVTRKSI